MNYFLRSYALCVLSVVYFACKGSGVRVPASPPTENGSLCKNLWRFSFRGSAKRWAAFTTIVRRSGSSAAKIRSAVCATRFAVWSNMWPYRSNILRVSESPKLPAIASASSPASMNSSGHETIVHRFEDVPDSAGPTGLLAVFGNTIYGTTGSLRVFIRPPYASEWH
jgi:hypothetical protein